MACRSPQRACGGPGPKVGAAFARMLSREISAQAVDVVPQKRLVLGEHHHADGVEAHPHVGDVLVVRVRRQPFDRRLYRACIVGSPLCASYRFRPPL